MRETTERVVFKKFDYYLAYRGRKGGDTSASRAAQSLRNIGIELLTSPVLKAYLFGLFTALCYDIVALLEARGAKLQEQEDTWQRFLKENDKRVDEWIKNALS